MGPEMKSKEDSSQVSQRFMSFQRLHTLVIRQSIYHSFFEVKIPWKSAIFYTIA